MSTLLAPYDLVTDPAAYSGIHLLETDGVPMESEWHFYSMFLLIALTTHLNCHRNDFHVGGNNFIYFNPQQARNLDYRGPDFFYIKDGVTRQGLRKYWAVWEENARLPDVILKLISPTTEREDRTTKFSIYEQTLRTPEYFLYNPDGFVLEGFRLTGDRYQPILANERGWLWSEQLGVWLGNWDGVYLNLPGTYVRFYMADQQLVLLPEEEERRRADDAERELLRLRALLAAKGNGPKPNGAGGLSQ